MTFGEHLEELRACLFKAIFGLVIGCLVGLAVGGYVVRFIQKPVLDALSQNTSRRTFRRSRRQRSWSSLLEGLRSAGEGNAVREEHGRERSGVRRGLRQSPRRCGLNWRRRKAEPARPPPPAATDRASAKATAWPSSSVEGPGRIYIWRRIADDTPAAKMNSLSPRALRDLPEGLALVVGAVLASPWIFYQHLVVRGGRVCIRGSGDTSTSSSPPAWGCFSRGP